MISDTINLKGYQSILCLNGQLPELSFFERINLPVIAADGAANKLHDLGIIPQIIIGDLDSLRPSIRESHTILHLPDQNSSDFQKSLSYLRENSLLPSIIVGVNGGYLDHILNNINIFMETDSLLYAPPIIGYVLKENSQHQFTLPPHTKISLMGMPSTIMTSKGLKWDLEHLQLTFPGKTSCFNRTKDLIVSFDIHHGSVLVLIYLETAFDAGVDPSRDR